MRSTSGQWGLTAVSRMGVPVTLWRHVVGPAGFRSPRRSRHDPRPETAGYLDVASRPQSAKIR